MARLIRFAVIVAGVGIASACAPLPVDEEAQYAKATQPARHCTTASRICRPVDPITGATDKSHPGTVVNVEGEEAISALRQLPFATIKR
jgi:hypothetical protein